MVKKFTWLLVLLTGIAVNGSAYDRVFRVQGYFNTMQVGEQGKVYLLSDNNIHLYDDRGHNIGVQRFDGGTPSSLGISTENEIYLFFRGSKEVQITDGNLARRRTVSLSDAGIENPGPACYAGQGKMWVYDVDQERFLLLDHNMEVRRESDPLSNFAFHTLKPLSVSYYDNHLFVNNDGHEVLVFNRFGTYMNRLDVRTDGQPQMADGKVFYIRHGRPHAMDISSGMEEQPALPFNFSGVREYVIKNNKLYMLSHGGLVVYQK